MSFAPRAILPLTCSKAPVPSGPRPVNTLSGRDRAVNPAYRKPHISGGRNTSNQSTPFENYSKNGQNASNPKAPREKVYDLQNDHNRRDDQHQRKRQKVENTSTSHNGSLKSPIDLDEESLKSSRQMGPPASKSGHSQASRQHMGVEEFHRVEETVGFARKKATSGSQILNGRGGESRFLRTASGQEIVKLDDPNDPVSEDEVAVTAVRHVKKNASGSARKSTLEVQIQSTRQLEGGTGYVGNANKHPSRHSRKIWGNGGSQAPAETGLVSNHFLPSKTFSQRRGSMGSHSTDDPDIYPESERLSRQRNGKQNPIEVSNPASSLYANPDASLDEISEDHFNTARDLRTAQNLLSGRQSQNHPLNKTVGKKIRRRSIVSDDSTDDEKIRRAGDIAPSKFVSTKSDKSKLASKGEEYDASRVFSETEAWLVDPEHGPWRLVHDPISKTLTLRDRGNSQIWDLPTSKLERIEYRPGNSILVIHKARDHTTGSGTHIYLKLCDSDGTSDLRESLKNTQPTLQMILKEA
jgi:hypothetical protein